MKFRFLGGMDCPDWLLAQICTNFSKFTSLKFRSLCQQAAKLIIEGECDQAVMEKCVDETSSNHDIRSTISLIAEWLLKKPAGYKCSADDLQKEMEQLGLPIEHSKVLHKIYSAHKDAIFQIVAVSVFKEPHAEIISSSPLTYRVNNQLYKVSISCDKLSALKHDLKEAAEQFRNFAKTLPSK